MGEIIGNRVRNMLNWSLKRRVENWNSIWIESSVLFDWLLSDYFLFVSLSIYHQLLLHHSVLLSLNWQIEHVEKKLNEQNYEDLDLKWNCEVWTWSFIWLDSPGMWPARGEATNFCTTYFSRKNLVIAQNRVKFKEFMHNIVHNCCNLRRCNTLASPLGLPKVPSYWGGG